MTREKLIEVMARAMEAAPFVMGEKTSTINATAALLALEAAGVRMVPVEATDEMALAGEEAMAKADVAFIMKRKRGETAEGETALDTLYAGDIYTAMLAASPYAQKDTKE